ncbi:MAG: hypothetical protein R3F34_05755 [Planctomycetota bacterium]
MDEIEQRIDAATEVRDGLPRVDWNAIVDAVGDDPSVDWDAYTRVWLTRLGNALSTDARLHETEWFMVLEAPSGGSSEKVVRFAEFARAQILRRIPGIASSEQRLVLVLLANRSDYFSYVADFYPEGGEYGLSAGMFISSGMFHIVLPGRSRLAQDKTLAHELAHALVSHLDLPLWLDEGIAVTITRDLFGPPLSIKRQEVDAHRAFWDASTIQEFWSGRAFSRPDDGQRFSYRMAEIFVGTLSSDYEAFAEFCNSASYADGGEGAALEVYGRSLTELAASFLGVGPWTPDPATWPEFGDED